MSFDKKAKDWDKEERRVKLAKNVAKNIIKSIDLNKNMKILDIGAGTGLLSSNISSLVKEIVALDTSSKMLEELKNKNIENIKCVNLDILEYNEFEKFDGIVSSMTLHHIKDIEKFFNHIYKLLKPSGFIAIADLTKEDGTFHTLGNEGVYHFGFSNEELKRYISKTKFKDFSYKTIYKIKKPHKDFDIFLLTAKKI